LYSEVIDVVLELAEEMRDLRPMLGKLGPLTGEPFVARRAVRVFERVLVQVHLSRW